jgi:hypothetical protein
MGQKAGRATGERSSRDLSRPKGIAASESSELRWGPAHCQPRARCVTLRAGRRQQYEPSITRTVSWRTLLVQGVGAAAPARRGGCCPVHRRLTCGPFLLGLHAQPRTTSSRRASTKSRCALAMWWRSSRRQRVRSARRSARRTPRLTEMAPLAGWYRGAVMSKPPRNGLFPASFIEISEKPVERRARVAAAVVSVLAAWVAASYFAPTRPRGAGTRRPPPVLSASCRPSALRRRACSVTQRLLQRCGLHLTALVRVCVCTERAIALDSAARDRASTTVAREPGPAGVRRSSLAFADSRSQRKKDVESK